MDYIFHTPPNEQPRDIPADFDQNIALLEARHCQLLQEKEISEKTISDQLEVDGLSDEEYKEIRQQGILAARRFDDQIAELERELSIAQAHWRSAQEAKA